MVMDLPLSSDSTAARSSAFFSARSANLLRRRARSAGRTFLHSPSNALRAAETAMSTSFSVASATETITSSVEGLMTSNVFLSTPSTHSLLMNLERRYVSANEETSKLSACQERKCVHVQSSGLLVCASDWRLELDRQTHCVGCDFRRVYGYLVKIKCSIPVGILGDRKEKLSRSGNDMDQDFPDWREGSQVINIIEAG